MVGVCGLLGCLGGGDLSRAYPQPVNAIAKVEPLTTARALRGPFDYRVPEGMRESVRVGSILMVPFARREILGVVTAHRPA